MKPVLDAGQHLPAIVIMTDGKSQGTISTFESAWRADGRRVPVFGVTLMPTGPSSTASPT
jgi:Ca-activated chloride channel family protein